MAGLESNDVRELGARRAVGQMERANLEDKHLNLMEENLLLKKHIKAQEDKMKRMATKLLKLACEDRKDIKQSNTRGGQRLRDAETEEMIEGMQTKLVELEQENGMLKNKVLVMKHQMEVNSKHHTIYSHIGPKTDTGLQRKGRLNETGPKRIPAPHTPANRYGHSLLEEARKDNLRLEEMVLELRNETAALKAQLELQAQEFQQKELIRDQEKIKLQEHYETHLSHLKRGNIKEDVEHIRLQRELREKGNKLTSLQSQFLVQEKVPYDPNVDTVHATCDEEPTRVEISKMKSSYSQVLQQMEQLNDKLNHEQLLTSQLQSELKASHVDQQTVSELQLVINDLKSEKSLLQQNNEKLIKAAFDNERDQHHKLQLQTLQDQIVHLESTSQSYLKEKAKMLDQLSVERELNEKLDSELREVKVAHQLMKEQNDDLRHKMSFFIRENTVDWSEVEKALTVVKTRPQVVSIATATEPLTDEDKDDNNKVTVQLEEELEQLRQSHANIASELGKNKKLLSMQQTISDQYKKEVMMINKRMVNTQLDCQSKLKENNKLMDIKTARIKKLEDQLHNIAYGTRPCNISLLPEERSSGLDEELEKVELQRGQNIFFFNVSKVTLSAEMVKLLRTATPSLFVTYGFYDFALSITPVMEGTRPVFDHTSQYVIEVDNFFLKYLQKNKMTLELHQAQGVEHRTLGTCQIKFRDVIHTSGERIHYKMSLTGSGGEDVGSVEYWMMIKLPMGQSARLHQERTKAQQLLDNTEPSSCNNITLSVTIAGCHGVSARRKGALPSPYAVYKFYNSEDRDTDIVTDSTSPQFNDIKLYIIPVTQSLHYYICTESLEVFVFDDKDPQETNYMGVATIALLPLAHDHVINGCYQLLTDSGEDNGTVEVVMQWKGSYTSSHKFSTPPLLPASQLKAKPPPIIANQADQNISNQIADEHEHKSPAHKDMHTSDDDHVSSAHLSAHESEPSIKTEDNIASEHNSPTEHPPVETIEDSVSLTPISDDGDKTLLQQSSELLPEHLTSGDPVEEISEELENCEDNYSDDTMFEEESTHSPITPLLESPSSEQPATALLAGSHDVPKFGGLGDLPSTHQVSPPVSCSNNATEEESGSEEDEDDSKHDNPITSTPMLKQQPISDQQPGKLSVSIHNFTMQSSPAALDITTQYMFVEYELLGFHHDDLETPSQPLPLPGHNCVFESCHSFNVESEFKSHLLTALHGSSGTEQLLITFTLVSDPIEGDTNAECMEFGITEFDLRKITETGRDVNQEKLEVLDAEDETTIIGYLTVSVTALQVLTSLSSQLD